MTNRLDVENEDFDVTTIVAPADKCEHKTHNK